MTGASGTREVSVEQAQQGVPKVLRIRTRTFYDLEASVSMLSTCQALLLYIPGLLKGIGSSAGVLLAGKVLGCHSLVRTFFLR